MVTARIHLRQTTRNTEGLGEMQHQHRVPREVRSVIFFGRTCQKPFLVSTLGHVTSHQERSPTCQNMCSTAMNSRDRVNQATRSRLFPYLRRRGSKEGLNCQRDWRRILDMVLSCCFAASMPLLASPRSHHGSSSSSLSRRPSMNKHDHHRREYAFVPGSKARSV